MKKNKATEIQQLKKGYKDGMTGFMVAVFSAFYQVVSYAKFWEYKTGKKRLDA